MNDNPLLTAHALPPFSRIRAEHVGPAIQTLLKRNLEQLSPILIEQQAEPTWEGLMQPLEDLNQRLLALIMPLARLADEGGQDSLAEAYESGMRQVILYQTALRQNASLFGLLQKLQDSPAATGYSPERHYALTYWLRDARLSGIGYERQVRYRMQGLQLELNTLFQRFGQNAQAAREAWSKDFSDETDLAGLTAVQRQALADEASQQGTAGWRLTLSTPLVRDVLSHAHSRALREEVYLAYFTQASDQSPSVGAPDNGPVIERILAARLELANLLGHESYAQRAMATRMFDTPQDVERFLLALLAQIRPAAQAELERLRDLAEQAGAPELQAWDTDYYQELYRRAHFGVSETAVRDYFAVPTVLQGLASLVQQLFDVRMAEVEDADTWHSDVRVFELQAADATLGYVYFDLYPRAGKSPGIWMQGLRDRHRFADGSLQLPLAHLSCDFIKPGDDDARLSLTQLVDLLHEFGHALHHVLTQVDHGSVAGIKGVAEDAVEFPSRLFELWAQEPSSVALMSAHRLTGEPIAEEFLGRVLASQRAFQATQMLQQIEFSLLDLRLHMQPRNPVVMPVVNSVAAEAQVLPAPAAVRYAHSFGHLFGTEEYACGYYTYVWSQVLAAETFARFRREGVLSAQVGEQLRELILSKGGTLPIGQLLERFTGRRPGIEALLADMGLAG